MYVHNNKYLILIKYVKLLKHKLFKSKILWLAFSFKKLCLCPFLQQISWNKDLSIINTISMEKHEGLYFKQRNIWLYEKFETYFFYIKYQYIIVKGLLIFYIIIG